MTDGSVTRRAAEATKAKFSRYHEIMSKQIKESAMSPEDEEFARIEREAAIRAATKRQWVGLTDDEVEEILDAVIGFNSCFGPETDFARAIEAKLKEKNT